MNKMPASLDISFPQVAFLVFSEASSKICLGMNLFLFILCGGSLWFLKLRTQAELVLIMKNSQPFYLLIASLFYFLFLEVHRRSYGTFSFWSSWIVTTHFPFIYPLLLYSKQFPQISFKILLIFQYSFYLQLYLPGSLTCPLRLLFLKLNDHYFHF